MRFLQLLLTLFFSVSFTAAWPWPRAVLDVGEFVQRRQDEQSPASSTVKSDTTKTSSSKPTATVTKSAASGSTFIRGSSATSASAAAESTGNTITATGKDASTAKHNSSTKTTQASSKITSVDPRLPAGGIEMLTPSAIAAASYYKIGDQVTFGWNYTSLVVPPSGIDVLVSCSANSATYTLSSNASVGPTGAVIWDTKLDATGSAPLLTETYTLVIHDASKDVTAVASAGYLGSYDQFTFGMYVPQQYTPLSDFVCATCSGALSDMERQTLKFLLGMSMITVLSFTWFVGGFGIV